MHKGQKEKVSGSMGNHAIFYLLGFARRERRAEEASGKGN
jgi:hypothetical protein